MSSSPSVKTAMDGTYQPGAQIHWTAVKPYTADEAVTICTPIGKLDLSLAARISYKTEGQAVTSAKLSTLGAQFASEIENNIYIIGGAQVKGATIDFVKLPQSV